MIEKEQILLLTQVWGTKRSVYNGNFTQTLYI